MKTADATALDKQGEHWKVDCPGCGNEIEFKGWFDCGDNVECKCGCIFKIKKVWLNDREYIE